MIVAVGVGAGLIMIVATIGAILKYNVYKRNKSNNAGTKRYCSLIIASLSLINEELKAPTYVTFS